MRDTRILSASSLLQDLMLTTLRTQIRIGEAPGDRVVLSFNARANQHDSERIGSLVVVVTDGKQCLGKTELTDHAVPGLFDMTVDLEGNIHLVWVERSEGKDYLMHQPVTLLDAIEAR
jgi:hypothetical protein